MTGLSATCHVEPMQDGGAIEVRAADSRDEKEAQRRICRWLMGQGVPEAEARPPGNLSSDPLSLRAADLERLLSLLHFRQQLPTIGFCFDKRVCERIALLLAGGKRMDFSNENAKGKIRKRLQAGLAYLDEKDKQLAQVKNSCELLVRGIGVHHGGMSGASVARPMFASKLCP